jgi:hypothetical protein
LILYGASLRASAPLHRSERSPCHQSEENWFPHSGLLIFLEERP